MTMDQPADRNLALELVRVTEAAAMAAAKWQGRDDKIAVDQAAVDAMRHMLSTIDVDGLERLVADDQRRGSRAFGQGDEVVVGQSVVERHERLPGIGSPEQGDRQRR